MANPLASLSFLALFEASADAMLLIDHTGHVVQANRTAQQLLEYAEQEICGLLVEALMPARFREQYYQYREVFFKNAEKRSMAKGREFFALSKSGKELAVNIGLSPIKTPKQDYILITFYVADKRRMAEQALRASEERLRLAKQAANLGVFDYDIRLGMVHRDSRTYKIWGGSPGKSVPYAQAMAAIHPEDLATRQAAFERASDPTGNGEYKTEFRIINADDGTERWVAVVGRVYFENGQAARLVGIVQDVTEHKLTEKTLQAQRAETEFVFKQQIAAQAAAAFAHEINQPLAAISAYSEVALHALNDATTDPGKLKRALEGCVTQAQRAGTSLHELLAFLQQGEVVTEPFSLNDLVTDALQIAKDDGYKEFHAILELEQNMPAVLANRIQIQKVLVNLLRNAVEAMRGAAVPASIITVTVRTNKEMSMGHVTVKDSGPGISQNLAKRIFEPFFTSKPTGIGMGLAISRALVEANGGQLWLEPDTKTGATFHFSLPFAA